MTAPLAEHEQLYSEALGLAARSCWPAALACFARAAALRPDLAEGWNNAAIAAWKAGRPGQAREYFEAALRLDPVNADYHYHLGRLLESQGEWALALDAYTAAAQLDDRASAHHRRGFILARAGQLRNAAGAHRAAVEREPSNAEAWTALGVHLCSQREFSAAQNAWNRARDADPDYYPAVAHSLLALHYPGRPDAHTVFAAHLAWGAQVESRIACLPAPGPRVSARIRIGYLSQDFGNHAVSWFVEPLLRHHSRDCFEVIAYADPRNPGAKPKLASFAASWHDVSQLSNPDCADLIRSHEVDVLVDLAGHTSPRARLHVFAARPARIHITALGYPDTTGLTRMDYRLTDSTCDPPGDTEGIHSERLLRLDPCFLCYAPPEDGPSPRDPGRARPFTFACFNSLPKMTGAVVETWAEILSRAPDSRLCLRNLEFIDPALRESVRSEFEAFGIDPQRIVCLPPTRTRKRHLEGYNSVDLALDPFPYNGGTITCDALWMGVPVLTLPGATAVARMGASILRCCGLERWIAPSRDKYIALAVEAAAARTSDASRRRLREQVRNSPLLDGLSYTRAFERLVGDTLTTAETAQSAR